MNKFYDYEFDYRINTLSIIIFLDIIYIRLLDNYKLLIIDNNRNNEIIIDIIKNNFIIYIKEIFYNFEDYKNKKLNITIKTTLKNMFIIGSIYYQISILIKIFNYQLKFFKLNTPYKFNKYNNNLLYYYKNYQYGIEEDIDTWFYNKEKEKIIIEEIKKLNLLYQKFLNKIKLLPNGIDKNILSFLHLDTFKTPILYK